MNRRSFLQYIGFGTGAIAAATLPTIVPKFLKDETETKNRPIMEHGFYGFFRGKVTSLMFEKSDGVVSFWGNGVCVRLAGELQTERQSIFSVEYNFDLYHTRRKKTPVLHLVLSEIGQIEISPEFEISTEDFRQILLVHSANILADNLIR